MGLIPAAAHRLGLLSPARGFLPRGATLPPHQITALDSLVTHLGVSVLCYSGVVKVRLTCHLSQLGLHY